MHLADKQVITQSGSPVGYFEDANTVVLDTAFIGTSLGRKLVRSGAVIRWQEGLAGVLRKEQTEEKQCKQVRIYQLGAEVEATKKFIGYGQLYQQFGGMNREEYACVFDGCLGTDSLGEIYGLLNEPTLPKTYTEHRLSISDLVELYDKQGSTFFYVDSQNFIQLEQEKFTHEKDTDQDHCENPGQQCHHSG